MSKSSITEGSIWKNLLIYFFPIWFGSIFQQMYTTIDAVIVGRFVGKEALAALGGTSTLLVDISVGFFVGASAGVGVVIAQYYGARDVKRLHYAIRTAIYLALGCGVVLSILGFFAIPEILRIMNTPEDVMSDALNYLQTYYCGVTLSLLYNMGSEILRASGDSKRPFYFLVLTTVINICLDLVFVAGLHMGTFGAALATISAQAISAILILRTLLLSKGLCRLIPFDRDSHPDTFRMILRLGLPSGFQYMLYTVSNLIVQARVNSLGTDVTAAWSALSKMDGIFWLTMTAFGTAITIFTGQNYGAGYMDRVRRGIRTGAWISCGLTACICLPLLIFARPLIGIFTTDTAVILLGVEYIFFLVPTYFTYTGTELLSGVIKGCGNSFVPMIITGISAFGIRSLWAIFAPMVYPGINTIMLSYPISWSVSTILFLLYFQIRFKTKLNYSYSQ